MIDPTAGEGSKTVALAVPSLIEGGGVPSVARFLYSVLEASKRYEPYLVSLAMSSTDGASVRLRDPGSWIRGVQVERGTWNGRRFLHVGARFAELEFMRYAPRAALTEVLAGTDLVQVVAGTPSWALPTAACSAPVALHVATLSKYERQRRLRQESGLKALWRRAMTGVTKRLDRMGLKRADRVFVMNRSLQREAAKTCTPDRIVYAPPGIDVKHFRPPATRNGGARSDYILTVGRFGDPRKNVELLFRAYAELTSRANWVPALWLAGKSGPPESAWRLAERAGITDRVQYLGQVSDHKLAGLYREATLFVLSSDEEGFGLVVVEAMASGCPVVSTDCGGPGDVISHGEDGLLVPAGDTDALAGAVETLLNRPNLRRNMGHQARQTAVNRFSQEVAGKRFLRTYDELLDREREEPSAARGDNGNPTRKGV